MNNTKFTPEFIEKQRELARETGTKPGHWWNVQQGGSRYIKSHSRIAAELFDWSEGGQSDANGDYLVSAANNYPAALDEITALRAERDAAIEAATAAAMLAGEYHRQLMDGEETRMIARYGREVPK